MSWPEITEGDVLYGRVEVYVRYVIWEGNKEWWEKNKFIYVQKIDDFD